MNWDNDGEGKPFKEMPNGSRWYPLASDLNDLESDRDACRDALTEYQRLSKVGRPSAVVDGVDMLNERYKSLAQGASR